MQQSLLNQQVFGVERPVAFVTGSGAKRVGQVIARRLAEAGYRLILHAHHSVDEVNKTCQSWCREGIDVSFVTGAVDDEQTIGQWIAELKQRYGALHVLVNSAATWEPTPLNQLDEAALSAQWRINLMGPTLLCRGVGMMMVTQPQGGAIVNIGDWSVLRPYRDFSAYMLTKGAIRTLTEVMAVELAERNPAIRVNAVFPGPVMLDDAIAPQAREKIIQQSLLKREGRAEDVAQAVQFLIESPFITGVCLPVDGGRSIYAGSCDDIVAHPTYDRSKST